MIRKLVKEIVLAPVKVVEGVGDAMDYVLDGPKKPKK
jgi:hypothetical protein